jgi:type VI secretion system secreted protein Hcp
MADIFAKIGDIKGESLDAKHKDEVEVLSWSWGVSQSGTGPAGGGGGQGKANFHDFNFTHHIDKSSPLLMKVCATGTHIKEATITMRKAWQGAAGVPDHQDGRRHHHRRSHERGG